MLTRADGTLVYSGNDQYTHVILDGIPVMNLGIVEVMVAPDGYGYVCTERDLPRTNVDGSILWPEVKVLIDGQTLRFTNWGYISVANRPGRIQGLAGLMLG